MTSAHKVASSTRQLRVWTCMYWLRWAAVHYEKSDDMHLVFLSETTSVSVTDGHAHGTHRHLHSGAYRRGFKGFMPLKKLPRIEPQRD